MRHSLPLLLLIGPAILFSNCTSDSKAGEKAKLPKALSPLHTDKIYEQDIVLDYIFDNEERAIDSAHQASRKLFLQAIHLYKKKKNYRDTLPLFKKSIALFPDAKAYNELGKLLYENGAYEECLKSYHMAIALDYNLPADLYFNMACAEAASSKDYHGSTFSYLNDTFH